MTAVSVATETPENARDMETKGTPHAPVMRKQYSVENGSFPAARFAGLIVTGRQLENLVDKGSGSDTSGARIDKHRRSLYVHAMSSWALPFLRML